MRKLTGMRPKKMAPILKAKALSLKSHFDVKETVRELKRLGVKHGPYFLVYAIIVEVLEDVVTPIILGFVGYPQFIPVVLALHSEPVMYPLYFAGRAVVRRVRH